MNLIVNKVLQYMKPEEWSEVEMMKMKLGLQVLIHDLVMVGFILALAGYLEIFTEAVILFAGYGLLKVTAGGIHFKKSWLCLLSTSTFIVMGTFIAEHIELAFYQILCMYLVCMAVLWIVAPQGTQNNPISPGKYDRLKRDTMIISYIYLLITIYEYMTEVKISYFLLVAIVFETISLLPGRLLGRERKHI